MQSLLKNYHLILESIEEGVFTVNLDFRIMSFNRAAEIITGVSRKDAIGKSCRDVFRTNICGTGCVLRQTIDKGKSIANMPVMITRADGTNIPISVNTAVMRATSGKIMGGVEIFRDMTALHEMRKVYMKQHTFDDIVSKSAQIKKYFTILPQIAVSDSAILIEGPTGTGKELFARAIHNHSHHKKGPFVAVNCGALPDTLIQSELFGYKAGAFTNAQKDKPGRFAMAQDGTIFLDEIGDISPAMQVSLLRVLQEKVYEPLGATQSNTTNARIICATHRNLADQVQKGHFREDLYYRINVMKLSLPSLTERKEDVPLLTDYFVRHFNTIKGKKITGLSQEAMAALLMHGWPGNVRELVNVIEHAFILCQGGLIDVTHLPENLQPKVLAGSKRRGTTLKDIERAAIQEALERNGWKKVQTARELGIDKNTLRRKMIRLNIPQNVSGA